MIWWPRVIGVETLGFPRYFFRPYATQFFPPSLSLSPSSTPRDKYTPVYMVILVCFRLNQANVFKSPIFQIILFSFQSPRPRHIHALHSDFLVSSLVRSYHSSSSPDLIRPTQAPIRPNSSLKSLLQSTAAVPWSGGRTPLLSTRVAAVPVLPRRGIASLLPPPPRPRSWTLRYAKYLESAIVLDEMMKSTAFSAVAVSVGYMLLGWDFTAVLEATLHMKKEFDFENGPSIDGIIIAVSVFGAIFITLFSGSLLDWLGRRAVLIHSSVLLFSGGLIMLWSPNIYILLLARLIVGSGTGLVFTSVPIYISETSPPNMRGSLGTMPQFMFIVGIILTYCMIFWMTLMPSPNWRIMIGSIFAPSIIYFALLLLYLPESPRWLVSDGKISEARVSLQWLREKDDVSGEIALIADGMNIIPDTGIGGHAVSIAQGQSFIGASTSQISHYSSLYWHLSDPLVDLLGSIHENTSGTGSVRNNFFAAFNSFNFEEHEQMNEHRGSDDSVQQIREAYPAEEGNNGDGLQVSLLSRAASVERYDTNTFTSEGSSSYLRRHGTAGFAQDFMASLHDDDIEEEEEEIHGAALSHQPAHRDVENTSIHPSRQQIARLSETAYMKPKWRVLLQPGVRHALCYGMLIQALQQSAGISGLLRYTPQILEQVGVVSLFQNMGLGSHSTAILISALNAFLMLPCITAAMMLMDICGRRALLLVTTPILMFSLGTISLSTIMNMGSLAQAILFHLTLTICFCSYVIGLGPIPNILCSEMFPTRARATCASFCSLSFWFGRLLSAYCFPVMLSTIGLAGACGVYAFVCCIALLFIYFRVPETKGLPLELIAEIFKFSRQECL